MIGEVSWEPNRRIAGVCWFFSPLWLIDTKLNLPHRKKKDQRMGRKVANIAVLLTRR
jgi:hypothetical protein